MIKNIYNHFAAFILRFLYNAGLRKEPLHSKLAEEVNNMEDRLPQYGENIIHTMQEGNAKIGLLINEGLPCMIARFGSTELSVIYHYYLNEGGVRILEWPDYYKMEINKQSGFFPANNKMLSKFSRFYIEHIKNIDILGVWYKPGEDIIVQKYLSNTYLTPLKALEPYYFDEPWSNRLKGKKILVIHPFSDTIKSQYISCHRSLFNQEVLPDFSLDVIKAVQSLGTSKTKYSTWFHAYDDMCNEISKKMFDVAIIGAGAYGLPLASFVKSLNKQAIHLGGATQILFGIKGKRWDNLPAVSRLYNNYWTRPSSEEAVDKENQLEDGCYW